jgi:hypothetical protein
MVNNIFPLICLCLSAANCISGDTDQLWENKFSDLEKLVHDQGLSIKEQSRIIQDQGLAIKEQSTFIQDQGLTIQEQSRFIQDQGLTIQDIQVALHRLETANQKVIFDTFIVSFMPYCHPQ